MGKNHQNLKIQRTYLLNTINRIGYLLRFVGLDPFRIDADKIKAKARKKAACSVSLPQLEEGLERLVYSINNEAKPNPFGALAVKGLCERNLYNRYKLEEEFANNTHIEREVIREPVFIIGMPRTGTTILHAMMHEDPDHRSPLSWECLLPFPASTPETFSDNDQLKTIQKEFRQLFKLVPDFLKKHYMAADSPQECLGITALDFNSFQFSAQLYLPSYMDWFANESDQLSTLRFHKRFLQYLQSGGVRSKRWLLKSPVHLMRLPEIFEVYPDARVIMTHRDPREIVSSTASLMSSVRSLYSDNEIPERTGKEQAEIWSSYFNRFLDSRKKLKKEDQIIDLIFEDFVKDQIGTVKEIYDHFGWELSQTAVTKFEQFLDKNPKDKYGRHVHSLETFGLTTEGISEQFKEYLDFLEYRTVFTPSPVRRSVLASSINNTRSDDTTINIA